MTSRTILTLALAPVLALGLLTACGGDSGQTPAEKPAETGAEALPDGLFVAAAPDGAKNVSEVKAGAAEGDTVVVRGRVGGPSPFVPGRAIMTLADTEALVACSDRPSDSCPEPWDYCCESPDKIAANSVTIEVVGPDGRPLKADLEGAGGIERLGFVVVTGKVGPRPDPSVLVIDASSIHVEN